MNGWFIAAIALTALLAGFALGFIRGVKAGWAWAQENRTEKQ